MIQSICKEKYKYRLNFLEKNSNLWRIFSVEELPANLDDLPQNTSVQRAFVKWLKEGNTIDRAFGAFVYRF